MRRLIQALSAATALGLAACALPFPSDPSQVLVGGGTFPSEEDAGIPTPIPDALKPGATASFVSKVMPAEAIEANKTSGIKYSPLIEFTVQGAKFSPRWPGATLAYIEGANPLPQIQRNYIRNAVDVLNLTVGYRVFTMLSDGSSPDIAITDSLDFASSTVLGETEAKVVSRYSPTTLAIDFTETIRLRARLSDNNLFYRVALHELGHAAGLEHNPDSNSLMNRGTSRKTPIQFSPSEAASLKLLYSLPDIPLKPNRETQSLQGERLIGWILP